MSVDPATHTNVEIRTTADQSSPYQRVIFNQSGFGLSHSSGLLHQHFLSDRFLITFYTVRPLFTRRGVAPCWTRERTHFSVSVTFPSWSRVDRYLWFLRKKNSKSSSACCSIWAAVLSFMNNRLEQWCLNYKPAVSVQKVCDHQSMRS